MFSNPHVTLPHQKRPHEPSCVCFEMPSWLPKIMEFVWTLEGSRLKVNNWYGEQRDNSLRPWETFPDLRAHPAFSREFGSPEALSSMGEPGGEEVAGKGVQDEQKAWNRRETERVIWLMTVKMWVSYGWMLLSVLFFGFSLLSMFIKWASGNGDGDMNGIKLVIRKSRLEEQRSIELKLVIESV